MTDKVSTVTRMGSRHGSELVCHLPGSASIETTSTEAIESRRVCVNMYIYILDKRTNGEFLLDYQERYKQCADMARKLNPPNLHWAVARFLP